MKIVVLDGHTLNPGDLSWSGIAQQGDLTVYERTLPEDTLARLEGAEIVFTNKTPLRHDHFAAHPQLRYTTLMISTSTPT